MTCTDSEAIGEIPGPSWPSSVNKRIGLIHSALKQLHLMGTEGAPTQLEELFRIIGAWLIKSRLTIILFLFWSSFQKMHTLPPPLTGLLHQWEAQTPPSVPSWCPLLESLFQSLKSKILFYLFFSWSPCKGIFCFSPLFSGWAGRDNKPGLCWVTSKDMS